MEEQPQTAPATTERKDTFDLITERVIEHLNRGTIPWRKQWTGAGIPRSVWTEKPFRNVNLVLLAMAGFQNNDFLTFKQINANGGSVKKGEKGSIVTIWDTGTATGDTATKSTKLNSYTLFNVSQCDKLPEVMMHASREKEAIVPCELIVKQMPKLPKIQHKAEGPQYDPKHDVLVMPKRKSFLSDEGYYTALFHQLIHSTGHDSRVPRMSLVQMSELGAEIFSKEEMIAEIGTMFLQSIAGITYAVPAMPEQLQGWIAALKADKRLLFTAAREAQKAVDFILNVQPTSGEADGSDAMTVV
jgi:antirestriction protein ArdC